MRLGICETMGLAFGRAVLMGADIIIGFFELFLW